VRSDGEGNAAVPGPVRCHTRRGEGEDALATAGKDAGATSARTLAEIADTGKSISLADILAAGIYPITVVCSGRILYITRTSPGFA